MKAQMCVKTGVRSCVHCLGADSIDGSPEHDTDASVSVLLTLHTHNFK